MGIFDRFRTDSWDFERLPRPWGDRPSIYEHIQAHRSTDGSLPEDVMDLPDDAADDNQIRFAPGASDGVFGHHVGPGDAKLRAKQLSKALRSLLKSATARSFEHFYELATRDAILEAVDLFLEEVSRQQHRLAPERFVTVARCLARSAPDRDAVKLGIAMLGVVAGAGADDDDEILMTLGLHEEFTLYVAVALLGRGASERVLFELAQKVHGWGRIEIVERLADTQDPEIQRWMLREGYKNSIMYEYTALTCATTGGLVAALRAATVDAELLHSAADILQALLTGAPGPGIEAYEAGTEAMTLFIGHVESAPLTLDHYMPVDAIRRHLKALDAAPAGTSQLIARCDAYLGRSEWNELIQHGLAAKDEQTFYVADTIASASGLDTWQAHFDRVREDPIGSHSWFRLMQQTTPDRIGVIVDLAESALPLDEIASGPSDALGLGPEFRSHSALDFILQDLGRFPGYGVQLLLTGLRSPVVRNRNMAIKAASEWTIAKWPQELHEALTAAAEIEPCDDVRERIRRVHRGDPMDPEDEE